MTSGQKEHGKFLRGSYELIGRATFMLHPGPHRRIESAIIAEEFHFRPSRPLRSASQSDKISLTEALTKAYVAHAPVIAIIIERAASLGLIITRGTLPSHVLTKLLTLPAATRVWSSPIS